MEIKHLLEQARKFATSGQHQRACEFCNQVLALDPANTSANFMLGRISTEKGKYDDAINYLMKVLERNPTNINLAIDVGRLLRMTGRLTAALDHLRSISVNEKPYPFYRELGLTLQKLGQLDEARRALFHALTLRPECKVSRGALVRIALKKDRKEDLLSDMEQILQVSKDKTLEAEIALYKAQNLLAMGDIRGSLERFQQLQSNSYLSTSVLAHKYIALSEIGDREGADYLYDYDKLVKRIPAICPDQFGSIDDFNNYLAHYLLFNQPILKRSETEERYSTINGQQTGPGQLFNNNSTLGNSMRKMIGKAFDTYLADISDLQDHPLAANRPVDRFVDCWSVVLNYQGHQKQHIHPTSWLSGCYYVQLPDDFDDQPEPDAGYLEFGRPTDDYQLCREPKTLSLKPVAGEFVIFPSYFWHRTIPLLSRQPRICIAFDWTKINEV